MHGRAVSSSTDDISSAETQSVEVSRVTSSELPVFSFTLLSSDSRDASTVGLGSSVSQTAGDESTQSVLFSDTTSESSQSSSFNFSTELTSTERFYGLSFTHHLTLCCACAVEFVHIYHCFFPMTGTEAKFKRLLFWI